MSRRRAGGAGGTMADRLRRLRGLKGWSMHDLARASGVSVATVSRAEAGVGGLALDRLVALAGALDASLDHLCFGVAAREMEPGDADQLAAWVDAMSPDQLLALWKWVAMVWAFRMNERANGEPPAKLFEVPA